MQKRLFWALHFTSGECRRERDVMPSLNEVVGKIAPVVQPLYEAYHRLMPNLALPDEFGEQAVLELLQLFPYEELHLGRPPSAEAAELWFLYEYLEGIVCPLRWVEDVEDFKRAILVWRMPEDVFKIYRSVCGQKPFTTEGPEVEFAGRTWVETANRTFMITQFPLDYIQMEGRSCLVRGRQAEIWTARTEIGGKPRNWFDIHILYYDLHEVVRGKVNRPETFKQGYERYKGFKKQFETLEAALEWLKEAKV